MKEEIKSEFTKYFENVNITLQNLWYTFTKVIREKFIALSISINKHEKMKRSELHSNSQNEEKKQQSKPKEITSKKIMKVKAGNKLETTKMVKQT